MKRMISVIVLAIVLASSSAWAADATAALDLNSAYVWRGITLNDGLVAQPSLDVSKNGFGLNVWGNYDIDDYDNTLDDNDFQEIDLTAYYSFNIDKLDFTVGVINYVFPSSGLPATLELYGTVGTTLAGGLSIALGFYYDVDEVESFYSDLSLSYAMNLSDKLGLEVGAKVGYAGEDFAEYYSTAATDGGFYDYGFSLILTYAVNDALSVGANINYTNSVDDDVLPDADVASGVYGVDTKVYGGVSIAYTF
ncbi:MAG: MltA-interacting MipA family protein [Desulfobacteraceae bacterium]|nr:MAG: MltA-interacting MipA family protein [Desulfobacteraceae bacterium]